MKDITHERIDDWDEELDENGKRVHYVNYVQYLRMESESDPWSLIEMVPKTNIVVDMPEPKRYMLPPRKGWFDPKDHYEEWNHGVTPYIKETVFCARKAGCDTCVVVVPGTAIRGLAKATEYSDSLITPACCVASLTAEIDDDATTSDSMEFMWHNLTTIASDVVVPPYGGEVNETMHPHEGKDPADAPANKWALFPEPEPEVIPKDYPKNLPPFSECLDHPIPDLPKKKPVTSGKKKKPVAASGGAPPPRKKDTVKKDPGKAKSKPKKK